MSKTLIFWKKNFSFDQKYVNIPFSKRVDMYDIDYSPQQATNVCLGVAN